MGKAIKWFKALFGLKKERKQSNSGDPKNKVASCMSRSPRGYLTSSTNVSSRDDTPLISPAYGRELNRRAHAVAVATSHAVGYAVVAAEKAVKYVAFTSQNLNYSAAITIQSMFRGYLARKAFKMLKSAVMLQAVVRGFLVRKGATETLQGMEAMFKVRSRICSQRSRLQDDKYHSKRSIRGSESRSRRMSSSFQIPNDAGLNLVEESPQRPKPALTRNNTCAWPVDSKSRTPSPYLSYSHRHSLPNVSSSKRFAYSSGPNDYESVYKQLTRDDSFTSNPSNPGYMANTESFRAKVRSQSAPKGRVGLNKRVGPTEVASGPCMGKSKSRSPSPLIVNHFKNFIMSGFGKS